MVLGGNEATGLRYQRRFLCARLRNHEDFLHHFGGKSGRGFKGARGMDTRAEEVYSWFRGKTVSNPNPRCFNKRAEMCHFA